MLVLANTPLVNAPVTEVSAHVRGVRSSCAFVACKDDHLDPVRSLVSVNALVVEFRQLHCFRESDSRSVIHSDMGLLLLSALQEATAAVAILSMSSPSVCGWFLLCVGSPLSAAV